MLYAMDTGKEKTHERAIEGKYLKAAVECWFTSSGRTIPQRLKYEDDDGILHTLDKIRLIRMEQKHYAGVYLKRYDCCAMVEERMQGFTLVFNPESGVWKIVMQKT